MYFYWSNIQNISTKLIGFTDILICVSEKICSKLIYLNNIAFVLGNSQYIIVYRNIYHWFSNIILLQNDF
jgi:hypothetical protein